MKTDDNKSNKNGEHDRSVHNAAADIAFPVPLKHSGSLAYASDYSRMEDRSFKDYPLVLLRYWFLIVGMVVVGAELSVLHTQRTPKRYVSSSLVNVGQYEPPMESPIGQTLRDETMRANYFNTQIRLLKSYTLAEQVLKDHPELRSMLDSSYRMKRELLIDGMQPSSDQDMDTGSEPALPSHVLQSYLGMISISALSGTTLVRIYSSAGDPQLAADVANAHARSFINLVHNRRVKAAGQNLKFLEKQHAQAVKRVDELEQKRVAYAEEHGLSYYSGGGNIDQQIVGIQDALQEAKTYRIEKESIYRELKRNGGLVAGVQDSKQLSTMRMKLATLETNYKQARQRFRSQRHPLVKEYRDQISNVKETLKNFGRDTIKEARNTYLAAQRHERNLESELNRIRESSLDKSQYIAEYEALKQETDRAKEVQSALSQRIEDVMINAQSTQETVAVVDEAFAPAYHSSPNERSNLLTGCFLGVLFGVLLALLLDYWDNIVRSPRDLERSVHVPVLGVVPGFSKELKSIGTSAQFRSSDEVDASLDALSLAESDIMEAASDLSALCGQAGDSIPLVSAPFSDESEAFRGILATLTSSPVQQGQSLRTILITSGQQGDGKTTLAINLAIALAQMSERTLLVDADLRLASVHKYFQLERGDCGLVECISGKADPSQAILESGVENLSLLLAGSESSNPASLLRSKRMKEMLDLLGEEFDYVILDTPPVGPVADALLLSRHVDGVAVVVRSGETPKPVAEAAIRRLRQVGARLIGLVLNDARNSDGYWKSGYSYYNYGRSYNRSPRKI